MSSKGIKALSERFGVDFQDAAAAIIETFAPFAYQLLKPMFHLSFDQSPKYLKAEEIAWIDELHLDSSFAGAFEQLIQLSRYGSGFEELCTTLFQRAKNHPPLRNQRDKFIKLEEQWVYATLIRVIDRLPQASPLPKSTVKISSQIFVLARKAIEQKTTNDWVGRANIIKLFQAFLEGEWSQFLLEYDDFYQIDDISLQDLKDLSYLLISFIHGRYAQAWSYLKALQDDRIERQLAGEHVEHLDILDDFSVELEQCLENIPSLFLRYPLVTGMKLGAREWKLEEPLGDEAWLCIDEMQNQGVLEEIWPIGGNAWMEQTQREAIALSQIKHDAIAPILDWGIDPQSGRWYMVYPFVKGESFLNRLQKRAMSEAEIRAFFIQLALGLEQCAKRGVFHRQIRLENLFFISDERVQISRFGIHRAQLPAWKWSFDISAFRRKFYAPEVFENGSMGTPSDIYSFAICMLICLFPESEQLPKNHELPKVFQAFFLKALHKDPLQRFLDWGQVVDVLKEIKPVYLYKNATKNQQTEQELSLLEVVAMILENTDDDHQVWQANFGKEWKYWKKVDEIEQLVLAALQREKERALKRQQKEKEEKEKELEKEKEREKLKQYLQNEHKNKNINTEEETSKERSSRANLLVRNHFAKDGVIKKKSPSSSMNLFYSTPQVAGSLHFVENGDLSLNFCYIPTGEFLMGAKHEISTPRLERPSHLVSFSKPFLMFQTPVTQALFESVMNYNPSFFYGKNRPVEQVSWFESAAFCNRLSQREGLFPAYYFSNKLDYIAINSSADGYRLPSEAEWEYAAKAGQDLIFAGADQYDEIGWFEENSQGQSQPVAQKKANQWGLYDMCGNVQEWCHDGLRPYTRAGLDPMWDIPEDESYIQVRAVRGGCWKKSFEMGKVTNRAQHVTIHKRKYIGFRMVRPLLPVFSSGDF